MATAPPFHLSSPPASAERLRDPIGFIREEHDRQCQVCDRLDELLASLDVASLVSLAEALHEFLTIDLPRHVEDEEFELFPLLARRCPDRLGLQDLLAQLAAEHELDDGLLEPILKELEVIAETGAPEDPHRLFMNVRAFTETQRRHLLWENRVVLPLAETELSEGDKQDLSHRLAARRGLRPSGGARP